MNISIIGSGNVADVMARLSLANGHRIQQVISRNELSGRELAQKTGAHFINITGEADKITDLVIVALSDNSLPEALKGFNFNDTPVVHTAGSVSMDVLRNTSTRYGVLYPLQSLRRDMSHIPPIPFLIEANNTETLDIIGDFARTLSNNVHFETEEKRLRLHAAAVIVNNFTNYLYGVAEDFCNKEQVDFNLLKPLISETASRLNDMSPSELQTGPAIRKDIITLDKHLRLLSTHPKLRTMYMRLTDGIMNP